MSRRGGSEESFEGFSWGEESQARAGSFVEFFGDRGEVGLVVGDGVTLVPLYQGEWVGAKNTGIEVARVNAACRAIFEP